jgi:serine/threonine protein kinase/tetratricopeptide (TPR) repeat protein
MASVLDRLRTALAPHFHVEHELASGGMGTVFLGHDNALDRRVAIKTLRPELSTAVGVERFVREAQYLAGLNHPNIIPVHSAGEADGLLYYVMDYVEGKTLESRLAEGPLSVAEVVRLGQDVLGALAAAHRKGVIHRDIKPANIFLVDGRFLLGDFGIARGASETAEALTLPGQVIGTLAYMAPEQLNGSPVTPQTDLYAMGLVLYQACTGRRWNLLAAPDEGDWRGIPDRLARPLRTALQRSPAARWDSAESFARALKLGHRLRPIRMAPLIPLAALGVYGSVCWLWPAVVPSPASSVALYPFEVVGVPDSDLGAQLARLTASNLEALPEVTVASPRTTFPAWRASPLPPSDRLVHLSGKFASEYNVWGVVRPAAGGVEVQLQVVNAKGEPTLATVVRGDAADRIGLSDSVALALVSKVFPRSKPLFRSAGGFAGINPRAVPEFLFGEDAAERDAWLTAERHYLNALALDSSFVLAAWRLANARRWMPLRSQPPLPAGFLDLYRAHRSALSPVDQLLVDAQFAPSGSSRFELYERARRLAPRDAYPPLYYGDELFHRGPLAGRSRDEAIHMLELAVELDSSLAPAHEHLAWALIRSGRQEQAGRSLESLHRVAGKPEESEIYLPALLGLAFAMRFQPQAENAAASVLQSPFVLGLAARGALSFDMPQVQAELGNRLASLPSVPPAVHGSGEVAQGVALMALGRTTDALAHFDSAARFLPQRAEARLQAAEWRVLPAALGLPGIPLAEVERGRRELAQLTQDSLLGPRAAWALALDALRRADTTAAADWSRRIDSDTPLAWLLQAMRQALSSQFESALKSSEPALAFDSAGRAGDPFFRSALHLQRGEWHLALQQPAAADAAWLWYENLDAVGWPNNVAQAAEVDWALGTFARWRRGHIAVSAGPRHRACGSMREVLPIWSQADSAFQPYLAESRNVARACPP